MNKIIIAILALILTGSCDYQEKYEKIYGNWECVDWIHVPSGTNKCNGNVYFRFQEDKTYYSQLGDGLDSGSYKIVDDMLFVDPSKRMEFSVRITKLQPDTMIFQMNNSGDEEILTLRKTK